MPGGHTPAPPSGSGNDILVANLQELEMYADPVHEKAFFNLLDNSIRYRDREIKIQVSSIQIGNGFMEICEIMALIWQRKKKKGKFHRDKVRKPDFTYL